MVREIVIWPDPILKKKAAPVEDVLDDSVHALIEDMFETMYAADGVGLAAPQVSVLKRIIVLDTSPRQPGAKPVAMVNPEILETEGSTLESEGCLSLPGESEKVARAAKVKVRFTNLIGNQEVMDCEGLLAIAVQHETDHLDGVVFVDKLSALKRELVKKRMKRYKAEKAAEGRASA